MMSHLEVSNFVFAIDGHVVREPSRFRVVRDLDAGETAMGHQLNYSEISKRHQCFAVRFNIKITANDGQIIGLSNAPG